MSTVRVPKLLSFSRAQSQRLDFAGFITRDFVKENTPAVLPFSFVLKKGQIDKQPNQTKEVGTTSRNDCTLNRQIISMFTFVRGFDERIFPPPPCTHIQDTALPTSLSRTPREARPLPRPAPRPRAAALRAGCC